MLVIQHRMARWLNCGKLLRALITTFLWETVKNTQGNDLEHSKNIKDWTIRSELLTTTLYWYMKSIQRLKGHRF